MTPDARLTYCLEGLLLCKPRRYELYAREVWDEEGRKSMDMGRKGARSREKGGVAGLVCKSRLWGSKSSLDKAFPGNIAELVAYAKVL